MEEKGGEFEGRRQRSSHNTTHKKRIEGRGEVKDCYGLAQQCVVVFGIFVFLFLLK
jgi:hypothetical protein